MKITDGFDPRDDEKVVAILKKWRGGVLSDELFAVIAAMTPQASTIIVVFRGSGNDTEVLLLPRPKTDPTWPGMLNLPGKMFRASDFKREDGIAVNGPIERIIKDELRVNSLKGLEFVGTPAGEVVSKPQYDTKNSSKELKGPEFVGPVFQDTKRGYVVVLVYLATLPEDVSPQSDWVWTKVSDLGSLKDYLKTEQSSIDLALSMYRAKVK